MHQAHYQVQSGAVARANLLDLREAGGSLVHRGPCEGPVPHRPSTPRPGYDGGMRTVTVMVMVMVSFLVLGCESADRAERRRPVAELDRPSPVAPPPAAVAAPPELEVTSPPPASTRSSSKRRKAAAPSDAPSDPVERSCCKVCSKGCACGDSCISCAKTCHKGPGCAC